MIGWIYKKDRDTYINLMNDQCGGPHIMEEAGELLHVQFCAAAATTWHMAGYWFQMG